MRTSQLARDLGTSKSTVSRLLRDLKGENPAFWAAHVRPVDSRGTLDVDERGASWLASSLGKRRVRDPVRKDPGGTRADDRLEAVVELYRGQVERLERELSDAKGERDALVERVRELESQASRLTDALIELKRPRPSIWERLLPSRSGGARGR